MQLSIKHNNNGGGKPAISVIVIDSRSNSNPDWVEKCLNSVKDQTLQNIELIVLNNLEKKYSIGKLYNQGVEAAEADWVYFLGDDDYVSPDFFASLVAFIDRYTEDYVVACSTYSTFFDDEKREMSINTMAPFGAFRREFLLKNKFDETLDRYIDAEMYKRVGEMGKVEGVHKARVCRWHFGYYYRQHGGMVSGKKIIKPNEGITNERKDIKPVPTN